MRALIAQCIAVAIASVAPPALAQNQAETLGAVDAVSRNFDDLQFTQDREALERVVSPDLIYITGSGLRADRDAFLEATMEPVSKLDPFVIREREVILLGQRGAAVTGHATISGIGLDGARFRTAIRFLDLFEFSQGQWKVVLVQVTRATADIAAQNAAN